MKNHKTHRSNLLRWYPRQWQERYGVEFKMLLEDTLQGKQPTAKFRPTIALAERISCAIGDGYHCRHNGCNSNMVGKHWDNCSVVFSSQDTRYSSIPIRSTDGHHNGAADHFNNRLRLWLIADEKIFS